MTTVCEKPLTARQKRLLAKSSTLITCQTPRLRAKVLTGGNLELKAPRVLTLDDFWKAHGDHLVRMGLQTDDKENKSIGDSFQEDLSWHWHLQTIKRPSIMS